MLTYLVLTAAILGQPGLAGVPDPVAPSMYYPAMRHYRPRVEVWTNRGDDPYRPGQGAAVFVRADRDAYITLFRVDTDGRVRVLFPLEPWEDNFVRGGREVEIETYHGNAFKIDDYPGVGYIFAVAAADPFDYDGVTSRDDWDYHVIADGRVRGDPYVALTDLAQRIVPQGYADWDYDIVPYYVERRYDYPRFLCYDCHSYTTYSSWDPYAYSCVRFRIVVFDDPYYYPYRYYGGTRVVFTRPFRPQPRFIFKDRGGVSDDRFVTRVRERPVNDNGRRGVRGADLGGRGSIPVPNVSVRRRGDRTDDNRGQVERPRVPPRRDEPVQPDDRRRVVQPQRQDREVPERRGDPGARPSDEKRHQAQRPDREARPPERERSAPEARPQHPREETRPKAQDGRPRAEPRKGDQPRAEPRQDKDSKSSSDRPEGGPELRRRRP